MPKDEQDTETPESLGGSNTVVSIRRAIRANTDQENEFSEPVLTDIRTCWPLVRQGIQEILRDLPQLTYREEDVYSECCNENALLFTSPKGFVVVSMEQDPFNGDLILLLWLAWAKNRGENMGLIYLEYFEDVAREFGCTSLEVRSAVPELEKYLTENGWDLDTRVFRRRI